MEEEEEEEVEGEEKEEKGGKGKVRGVELTGRRRRRHNKNLACVLRHASTSSSVVLPAPDAPISASRRPGTARPLMPLRIVRCPPPRLLAMSTV